MVNMTTDSVDGVTTLCVQDSDVSSRKSAGVLRKAVETFTPCSVDFGCVRSMSHAFADEFFAVLIARHGNQWFKQNVKVENLDPAIREQALKAVAIRCEGIC